jgi:hypothetical protein
VSRVFLLAFLLPGLSWPGEGLRAGVHEIDISPRTLPIIVSGGFLARSCERLESPLTARALVLDDGRLRLAIAIVDTLMMPRELLDEVKARASRATGIPVERMLIAATHTHSAPPLMGALGTDANPDYIAMVRERLVELIERAAARLVPARIGWAAVDVPEYTHCRQWILRPDKIRTDPFGEPTVRANMHPGYQNPDFIGPTGPVDPELSLVAVQTLGGQPLAVLANYSMHYVGVPGPLVSPDYFGHFSEKFKRRIGAPETSVVMMSQGTSGDLHWMDYGRPRREMNLEIYSEALAGIALEAYRKIRYRESVELGMLEERLTLRRRTPDARRLAWARELFSQIPEGKPRNQPEVYAREQIYLHEEPVRELKLQVVKIGELAIAAIPNEVFAITGLKIKGRSPFARTFTIELANGAEGYIPPPELFPLGGYTTWPARTAALETEAETRIVETVVGMLERLAGKARRPIAEPLTAYADFLRRSRPAAWWRFGEISGTQARDHVGGRDGVYQTGYALYLDGAATGARAVHLAGGHVRIPGARLGDKYTVELIFWNGLDNDARSLTGYLWSAGGEALGIQGASGQPGRLFFGGLVGRTAVAPKSWNHVAVVRDGAHVSVYLNGSEEMSGPVPGAAGDDLLFGAAPGETATLEGKLDEAALLRRPLGAGEVRRHSEALRSRLLH